MSTVDECLLFGKFFKIIEGFFFDKQKVENILRKSNKYKIINLKNLKLQQFLYYFFQNRNISKYLYSYEFFESSKFPNIYSHLNTYPYREEKEQLRVEKEKNENVKKESVIFSIKKKKKKKHISYCELD